MARPALAEGARLRRRQVLRAGRRVVSAGQAEETAGSPIAQAARNLPLRIGAAKAEAGCVFGFVTLQLPDAEQPVTRDSFRFRADSAKLKQTELRDGYYLLHSNLTGGDPTLLWSR